MRQGSGKLLTGNIKPSQLHYQKSTFMALEPSTNVKPMLLKKMVIERPSVVSKLTKNELVPLRADGEGPFSKVIVQFLV